MSTETCRNNSSINRNNTSEAASFAVAVPSQAQLILRLQLITKQVLILTLLIANVRIRAHSVTLAWQKAYTSVTLIEEALMLPGAPNEIAIITDCRKTRVGNQGESLVCIML